MKIKLFDLIGTFVICGLLNACSTTTEPGLATTIGDLVSAELFMSRRHLSDTDFEQYKVESAQLFSECGNIRRGRYIPMEQDLISLATKTWQDLSKVACPSIGLLANAQFNKPGNNSWLADPGQLYLTLTCSGNTPLIVKTSLDSVASATSKHEKILAEIISTIRTTSDIKYCGNAEFYGIK